MTSSLSYAARALLAVALMVGFYALALTIAGGLLYLIYFQVAVAHRINAQLTIFSVVGAGLILWSILPRVDRFVAPGPTLPAQGHPALFALISQVAAATEQQPPSEVYLVPEVNAWVAQRGGLMGFGSRRVMGLGLPLLRVLSVPQLRAVLGHEFGHFHGGDTRLGPWIYKTRSALGRTLGALGQHSSFLQKPFSWYANLYLRITQAISRRQELSADALSARHFGPQPLQGGLRTIAAASMAYDAYWKQEVVPVLQSGFLPPLAEGFARFLAAPPVSKEVRRNVEQSLAQPPRNPFDSHPPLAERLAALASLPDPAGGTADDDDKASSLLVDVPGLERKLLAGIAGEAAMAALKEVPWAETAERVFLPAWRWTVAEHATAVASTRAEGIPLRWEELSRSDAGLKRQGEATLSSTERRGRAANILGAALAVALHRTGWRVESEPGEPVFLVRGPVRLNPFSLFARLESGDLTDARWKEQCANLGIGDLDLSPSEPERSAGG